MFGGDYFVDIFTEPFGRDTPRQDCAAQLQQPLKAPNRTRMDEENLEHTTSHNCLNVWDSSLHAPHHIGFVT